MYAFVHTHDDLIIGQKAIFHSTAHDDDRYTAYASVCMCLRMRVCYCSTFCGDRGDLSPARELNEVRRWRRRSVNENDRCPGKTTAAAQRVNLFPDLYVLLLLLRTHTDTHKHTFMYHILYVMCVRV